MVRFLNFFHHFDFIAIHRCKPIIKTFSNSTGRILKTYFSLYENKIAYALPKVFQYNNVKNGIEYHIYSFTFHFSKVIQATKLGMFFKRRRYLYSWHKP